MVLLWSGVHAYKATNYGTVSEKYANMHDARVTYFISTVVVLIVQCFGVNFMYWLHLMYIFIN